MGLARSQDGVAFAAFARRRATDAILVAMPAPRLAEPPPEAAVGELDVVVRREQANHRRQGLQHIEEALPLGIQGFFGQPAFRGVAAHAQHPDDFSVSVAKRQFNGVEAAKLSPDVDLFRAFHHLPAQDGAVVRCTAFGAGNRIPLLRPDDEFRAPAVFEIGLSVKARSRFSHQEGPRRVAQNGTQLAVFHENQVGGGGEDVVEEPQTRAALLQGLIEVMQEQSHRHGGHDQAKENRRSDAERAARKIVRYRAQDLFVDCHGQ